MAIMTDSADRSMAEGLAFKYKVDMSGDSTSSILGSEFAQFVAYKAFMETEAQKRTGIRKGRNTSAPALPKRVDPFKPVFFTDPKFNPAISNTHICYEYDAHYKEVEKQWNRAGKKFSDEPRIGKPPASDQGPTKQYEFPQWCEREHVMFGRQRKLKPFSRAQQYTRPVDRCTIPFKPTKDDEVSHLGPGSYMVPDPWKAKTGHGNIAGTHPLISTSPNVTTIPVDPDNPPLRANLFNQQLTGSSPTRAKSPKSQKRFALAAIDEGALVSTPETAHASAIAGAARLATPGGGKRQLISAAGLQAQSTAPAPALGSVLLAGSRITKESSAGLPAEFSDSAVWDFYPPGGLQTRSSVGPGVSATVNVSGSYAATAGGLVAGSSLASGSVGPSRSPGFRFSKSTFATGCMDIVTGTTNADLLYRRVKMDDGSQLIYATSKVVKDLPRGASEVHLFGADKLYVDDTLHVVSNITSPIKPTYTGGYNLESSPSMSNAGSLANKNKLGHSASMGSLLPSPVSFLPVHSQCDDSTNQASALPGPTSAPLLPQPKNSPFRPPTVLKKGSPSARYAGAGSPPKTAPARARSATALSVRNSELIALALTEGSTESYRRMVRKQADRNTKDDALGAQKAKMFLQGGGAEGVTGTLGLDASLVESLGSHFLA